MFDLDLHFTVLLLVEKQALDPNLFAKENIYQNFLQTFEKERISFDFLFLISDIYYHNFLL